MVALLCCFTPFCTLIPMIKTNLRLFPFLALAALLTWFAFPGIAADNATAGYPRLPFPVRQSYPDHLSTPDHKGSDQQDQLVRTVYDRWKANYLSVVPEPQTGRLDYRITAGKRKPALTYSEGQGYGMMLVVYMAGYDPEAQTIFDGLYRFSRQHPSTIETSFMAYQVPAESSRQTSAFDGDADIAFALLLADRQWGSDGTINYRAEALELIGALSATVIGRESRLPMLGDWVLQDGVDYDQYTIRSSDIMPAHFKLFEQASGDGGWETVTKSSQALIDFIQQRFSPGTGLVPDFIVGSSHDTMQPAPGRFLESIHDGAFYYNAARVPWRLGEDGLQFGDATSMAQLQRIAKWVITASGGDPAKIGPGFNLDGTRLDNDDYLSMAFIAPFGVAAMTLKDQQSFVNETFDLCVSVQQDYYEDTISLFCLLLMTGNYWMPTTKGTADVI